MRIEQAVERKHFGNSAFANRNRNGVRAQTRARTDNRAGKPLARERLRVAWVKYHWPMYFTHATRKHTARRRQCNNTNNTTTTKPHIRNKPQ